MEGQETGSRALSTQSLPQYHDRQGLWPIWSTAEQQAPGEATHAVLLNFRSTTQLTFSGAPWSECLELCTVLQELLLRAIRNVLETAFLQMYPVRTQYSWTTSWLIGVLLCRTLPGQVNLWTWRPAFRNSHWMSLANRSSTMTLTPSEQTVRSFK